MDRQQIPFAGAMQPGAHNGRLWEVADTFRHGTCHRIAVRRASGCSTRAFAAECAAFDNKTWEIEMTELSALWLPILLGAVFIFIVSAIFHMGPFWHKNDFPQLPDE